MNFFRRLVITSSLVATASVAQLSGGYTIDSSLPPGGGNYIDFASAITALTAAGVNGPVTFTVYPGVGNYLGWQIVGPVVGASVANTITFAAAPATAPVISGVAPGNLQAVKLGATSTVNAGPQWINLVGLTVTGAATGAGIGIHGGNNCRVTACTVFSCGSGISLAGTSNTIVEDCEVYTVGVTVGSPGSTAYAGGISAYLNSDNVTIRRNRVHDTTGPGIFVGTSGDTTACDNPVIINNMIWNCVGTGTYPGGLSFRRAPGAVVANNSILMASGALAGISVTVLSSATAGMVPFAVMANNVIEHLGTGPCIKFDSATTLSPIVFDSNLYAPAPTALVGQVVATNYATLPAWQAVANVVGKETSSMTGSAGWVSSTDLHITGASSGLFNGLPLAQVTDDIDMQPRLPSPCRGADETVGTGIFANFQANVTAGPAALNVLFTDTTYSSNGPPATYAWDFQNDNVVDSTLPNPSFTYVTPGIFTVSLTVTDPILGSSTRIRTAYINVSQYVFSATTTGSGTGDLTVTPVPNLGVPTMTEGYTLVSFTAPATLGSGPFFGLVPDAVTFAGINYAAAPGNPLHFVAGIPGVFPNAPFIVPPGVLTSLAGAQADFVQVCLNASFGLAYWSPVSRLTF